VSQPFNPLRMKRLLSALAANSYLLAALGAGYRVGHRE
jgi:hypothetical protein